MSLLTIIIPAHNEELGVERVLKSLTSPGILERMQAGGNELEIIVVNDGSTDSTPEVVKRIAETDRAIRLVNHYRNMGYGKALKTGFREARGDYIGFLDADGSYAPESICVLFLHLIRSQADVVWGSRLMNGRGEMPVLRWIGNQFFRGLTNLIFKSDLTDVTSGMRVFRKDLASEFLSLPYGLEFSPAMSAAALQKGMKVVELPIPYRERIGKSKLKIVRDGFRFLGAIVMIKMEVL